MTKYMFTEISTETSEKRGYNWKRGVFYSLVSINYLWCRADVLGDWYRDIIRTLFQVWVCAIGVQ